MPTRLLITIDGIVQGVGFRPFVYRLARAAGLGGTVRNDGSSVLVDVEGDPGALATFLRDLETGPPPLARITALRHAEHPPSGATGFAIVDSTGDGAGEVMVSPDVATCDDCLAELRNPADRRYRYPFINCTHCGPRYTIIQGVPYDRPRTTMARFPLCDACRREYEDPGDRRFHAQPVACPACGPRAQLLDADGNPLAPVGRRDTVEHAAALLGEGAIVAIKGLGGFHLACLAAQEDAVARLRSRKHREEKPFAIMTPDLDGARGLVHLDAIETALLASPERPIVLARRRPGTPVAPAVAPGTRDLGVMLPYTPLHHLLFAGRPDPLVMTSGNVSDEPIAYGNTEALSRLQGIADAFLVHDRPIETRVDDSVVRVVTVGDLRRPMLLRRSRGYVPTSLPLPVTAPEPLLACGAELKSTFTLAAAGRAWPSQHIGDLENFETLTSYTRSIERLARLLGITPVRVLCDAHPDYLSTKYAVETAGDAAITIQHHHAHLAACLAEHGETGPALGVIFDGTGYGTDGTVWGGEFLAGTLAGSTRVGHLRTVRLPGGAAAIREPWRMTCAWLTDLAGGEEAPPVPKTLEPSVKPSEWAQVAHLSRTGFRSPVTSSMGRLFDAVSALLGIRSAVTYEGQAAIELERVADPGETGELPFDVHDADGVAILDPRPALQALLKGLEAGTGIATLSARFHRGVAGATARMAASLARREGIETVVLAGGVFQNVLLLENVAGLLASEVRILVPVHLPPNDGSISYGQAAAFAAWRET